MKTKSTSGKSSRYVQGGTTDVYPDRLGWWERFIFKKDITDIEYVIEAKYHRRPDKLAYDVYGTAKYQTFILQYNNILDDITEFVTGNKILLPAPRRVSMDLMGQPTGGNPIEE